MRETAYREQRSTLLVNPFLSHFRERRREEEREEEKEEEEK